MKKKEKRCHGFTLIEVIVALGLFSFVITTVIGIFVSGSNSQKKALELFEIQREANHIMEIVSRELRMAKGINNDQSLNNDSDITFINHDNIETTFCLSDIIGTCDSSGKYFSIDGRRISSKDVFIENLKFYTNDFSSGITQNFVTVYLDIKSTTSNSSNIRLQTSISMRIYE